MARVGRHLTSVMAGCGDLMAMRALVMLGLLLMGELAKRGVEFAGAARLADYFLRRRS